MWNGVVSSAVSGDWQDQSKLGLNIVIPSRCISAPLPGCVRFADQPPTAAPSVNLELTGVFLPSAEQVVE